MKSDLHEHVIFYIKNDCDYVIANFLLDFFRLYTYPRYLTMIYTTATKRPGYSSPNVPCNEKDTSYAFLRKMIN